MIWFDSSKFVFTQSYGYNVTSQMGTLDVAFINFFLIRKTFYEGSSYNVYLNENEKPIDHLIIMS